MSDVRVIMDEAALAEFFTSPTGPVARVLLRYGYQTERLAKHYCPVDTGRLRASIATTLILVEGHLECWVGTDVEYAPYVEFGTRFMAARSYLRRALHEVVGAGGGVVVDA